MRAYPVQLNVRDPHLAAWMMSNPVASGTSIIVTTEWQGKLAGGFWPEVPGARDRQPRRFEA